MGLGGCTLFLGASIGTAAPISIHQEESERYREFQPFHPESEPAEAGLESVRSLRSNHQFRVFGYLPYWSSGYSELRWDVLTDLAWFAIEMNGDGSFGNTHGWGDAATEDLISTAHSFGVRVHLTTTNFQTSEISTLVQSPTFRATAITNLVQAANALGADGINIDFEGLALGDRDAFVAFIQELKGSAGALEITLATPAIDWQGAWDYDVLAESSDGLFIMGYGYHWSGGDPGPIAPRDGGSPWGGYSLSWTVADYLQWGGVQNSHKFILGLPLYGRDWPSVDAAIPGTATASGVAIVYVDAVAEAALLGSEWEPVSSTPYYMYQSTDGIHQVWYDDDASILEKCTLVLESDLGGVGFWALNYDATDPVLWDGLSDLFRSTVPALDDDDAPPPPTMSSCTCGFSDIETKRTFTPAIVAVFLFFVTRSYRYRGRKFASKRTASMARSKVPSSSNEYAARMS